MVAKELDPLVQAVRCHGAKWRGKLLNVATDNTGVVYAINAGRAKSHAARQLMRDVADLLQDYDIDIAAQWVPRELNVVADLLSRQLTLEQALEQSGVVRGVLVVWCDCRFCAGEAPVQRRLDQCWNQAQAPHRHRGGGPCG